VAFEGERRLGTRHAHILVYLPTPIKKMVSREIAVGLLPTMFRTLWDKFGPSNSRSLAPASKFRRPPGEDFTGPTIWERADLNFMPANEASVTYAIKDARRDDVSWSRLEFVTPPKYKRHETENLNVIRNRNKQKRKQLGLN
jgi:hypothetical protein